MIRYPVVVRRSLLALACLFAPTVGDVTSLKAQSYPTRSIKLVVPFGPGDQPMCLRASLPRWCNRGSA